MFTPTAPSDHLLFSTARIEARTGTSSSIGTGFFFRFKINPQRGVPVLITNKHVVKGCESFRFLVHRAADPTSPGIPHGENIAVDLRNEANLWIDHPGDSDLCAIPTGPLEYEAKRQGHTLYYCPLEESLLPTSTQFAEMKAIEDVVMVGYPTGLWDEVNNLPILRRGTTASHPTVDFNGRPIGVIDLACFPGSSGSPVMIVNENMYTTKSMETHVGSSRIILLGILFAGPVFGADGTITIEPIPTAAKVGITTQMMIHLGYYVKAQELITLKQHVLSQLRITPANL